MVASYFRWCGQKRPFWRIDAGIKMMARYQSYYHLGEELSRLRASAQALRQEQTRFVERTAKSVWLVRNEEDQKWKKRKKKELGVVGRDQVITHHKTKIGFYSNCDKKLLEGFEEGWELNSTLFIKITVESGEQSRWAGLRGCKWCPVTIVIIWMRMEPVWSECWW